ncbi:hypothetical protein M5K25_028043 [Dendrobium thyrsiflorum]|uniref:Uncharacterized protein n=1 Tax=Dendrobium thyrsiflorum TaxID=117978 RepID=A0ABD0TVD1_DENTH
MSSLALQISTAPLPIPPQSRRPNPECPRKLNEAIYSSSDVRILDLPSLSFSAMPGGGDAMNLTGLLHCITGNLLYPLLENESGVGELHLHALLPPRLGELQHPAIFVRLPDGAVCGLTAPRHLGLGISTRATFIGELACDGFGEGFGGATHAALEVELGAELAYFCEGEGEVAHDGGEGIGVERGSGGFVGEEEMGGIMKGIR